MINKPALFKGLNIRIPSIILIKGRGFLNHREFLGRPLGCLIFSRMALIGGPIYYFFSKGVRGQPRFRV